MTVFSECFEHRFDYSLEQEISAGLPVRYFSGGTQESGRDGLLVRFDSDAGEWIGVFAFGDLTPNAISGVYSCPDDSRLCVVSRGQGVYVSSVDPTINELVPLDPVMGVFPAPSAGVLIMHDFTRFVAYGRNGLAWKTPSLSWDGIKSVVVDGSVVKGLGWDAPSGEDVSFEIELESGLLKGGSSPEILGNP